MLIIIDHVTLTSCTYIETIIDDNWISRGADTLQSDNTFYALDIDLRHV